MPRHFTHADVVTNKTCSFHVQAHQPFHHVTFIDKLRKGPREQNNRLTLSSLCLTLLPEVGDWPLLNWTLCELSRVLLCVIVQQLLIRTLIGQPVSYDHPHWSCDQGWRPNPVVQVGPPSYKRHWPHSIQNLHYRHLHQLLPKQGNNYTIIIKLIIVHCSTVNFLLYSISQ